ncbi:transposase [Streptomyces sp. 2314.4]
MISDSHRGLEAAIRTVFLGAAWQRCGRGARAARGRPQLRRQ